jgi:hypothetical protein
MLKMGWYVIGVSAVFSSLAAQAVQLRNPRFHYQEQSNWCWAATTQSVIDTLGGRAPKQCQMVSRLIAGSRNDACCDPRLARTEKCNQGYQTPKALDYFDVLQDGVYAPVSQETLEKEIAAGFPVAIRIQWESLDGHAMMIYGATATTINVWDPANGGDRYLASRNALANYHGGKWAGTFTTRRPRP